MGFWLFGMLRDCSTLLVVFGCALSHNGIMFFEWKFEGVGLGLGWQKFCS